MNIIDTHTALLAAFDSRPFDLKTWASYIDAAVPGAKELCLADMNAALCAGYTWEKDFLPVLSAAFYQKQQLGELLRSFRLVTDGLDQKLLRCFGKTMDADIILYLGLCNGAGWVTQLNYKTVILLGIEKIIELNWCSVDAMNGLILHELGHVYHAQYGVLERDFTASSDRFLWQLFTEGIAMVFEQSLIGNSEAFHQDRNGWKSWCDKHTAAIAKSFAAELDNMTPENQRYFGDWVSFEGYPDVGYYLGARFIRFILKSDAFDRVILYDISDVRSAFDRFLRDISASPLL